MLKIESVDNPFTPRQVVRPVQIADHDAWPGALETNAALAGSVLYDVYIELMARGDEDIIGIMTASIERFMTANGAKEEDIHALRSNFWRSAHKFLVRNVDLVDRGQEITDLAKLLKVK